MIDRMFFCLLTTALLLTVSVAQAQQSAKVPRIGYVTGTREPTHNAPDANRDAFRQGLRDLGYIEGKNIAVEYRYGARDLDRAASLVAELMHLKVDVLVVVPLPAIQAAKQATKTIPIVMVSNQDPVATGIIDSLARPGGNITGISRLTRELSGKRLELLKEIVPRTSRVGILLASGSAAASTAFTDYEAAAQPLKIALHSLPVSDVNPDFERVFQDAANARLSAIITVRSTLLLDYRSQIAALALKNRLPSLQEGSEFVEAGGLISYTGSDTETFRRAATYVDKILKGARPAELPVEQPRKFELVINLKTAKQIGLTIPESVLFRVDRVIK